MVALIIRGTTPTHTFTLPLDCSTFQNIRILYSQGSEPTIKREMDSLKCEGNKVSCTLTQEETLALDCTKHCDIQLRALTLSGDALACDIKKVSVGRCLDNEVLK
jgi:hypothetical protein